MTPRSTVPTQRSRPRPANLVALFAAAAAFLLALVLVPGDAAAQPPQVRVNSDATQQLQNEQQIAINPTDPQNVVAAWRDFRLGYRQVGVGYSLDGGATWTDYLVGGTLPWDSDPVLIVHSDGTFYLVVVNYQDGGANQLAVHRSTDKGMSWEGPFSAVYSSGSTFEDKEWIAVDQNPGPANGRLAISWSRFYDVKVMVVTSSNRGQNWSSPVQVSAAGSMGQWSNLTFLRNGNLLVAWDDYSQNRILYDISTNGGTTWGTDQVLTTVGTSIQSDINGGITVFPYPVLQVDRSGGPRDGFVYCMYSDRAVSANGMDIWCRRSTNQGTTWSAAVRVNDDPTSNGRDQFHPWMDCSDDGTLVATWYDRRDDAANYLWHIYSSTSTDGGLTWAANTRLTSVASSPANALAEEEAEPAWEVEAASKAGDAAAKAEEEGGPIPHNLGRAGLIGEYSGVAARLGRANAIWTDTRNGNQDAYATAATYASAVPGPADGTRLLSLQAWPNPAANGSEIHLRLAEKLDAVVLHVVDATGRELRRIDAGAASAGETVIPFDGRDEEGADLPAGVYWVRLEGGPTTKMVLLHER